MVVSNSLVHHLPEPLPFFLEVSGAEAGSHPDPGFDSTPDQETINGLVEVLVPNTTPARNSYSAILHAALTLDEVNCLIEQAGLQGVMVYQSSDRHWTAERLWSQES